MLCGQIFSAQLRECMAMCVFPFKEPYLKVTSYYVLFVDSTIKNITTAQMLTATHTNVREVKKRVEY